MKITTMSELKPCPFCGKPLHVFYNYRLKAWTWHCDTENCAGRMLGYDSEDEAAAALNRRAQPANEPLTQADVDKMHFNKVWISYGDDTDDGEWGVILYGRMYSIDVLDGADFEDALVDCAGHGETLDRPTGQYVAYRRKPEGSENDA